jgi:uncharacterized repeat protein (TIGR01451 family)
MRRMSFASTLFFIAGSALGQQADLKLSFDGTLSGVFCPDFVPSCDPHTMPVPRGGTAFYTLIIENLGPSTATNVTATVTFPANTTIDHFNVGGGLSCNSSVVAGTPTLSCSIASLGVGALPNAGIFLVVNQTYSLTTLVATAAASATTTDPVASNNSGTVTLPVVAPVATLTAAGLVLMACVLSAVALIALRRF